MPRETEAQALPLGGRAVEGKGAGSAHRRRPSINAPLLGAGGAATCGSGTPPPSPLADLRSCRHLWIPEAAAAMGRGTRSTWPGHQTARGAASMAAGTGSRAARAGAHNHSPQGPSRWSPGMDADGRRPRQPIVVWGMKRSSGLARDRTRSYTNHYKDIFPSVSICHVDLVTDFKFCACEKIFPVIYQQRNIFF